MPDKVYRISDLRNDGFALHCDYQSWSAGTGSAKHRHDGVEILYVTKGGGTNVIAGVSYPIIPGDVYVIPIGDSHSFSIKPNVEFYNLLVQPRLFNRNDRDEQDILAGFMRQFEHKDAKVALPPVAHGGIARLLSQLNGELIARRAGYRGMAKALFINFLVLVLRYCREDRGSGAKAEGPIAKVLGYMHEHYHEPISVEDLAELAGLSANHFGEVFKSKTGNCVKAYLNRVRVERARFLLDHEDHSVTEVALSCGFQDLSYFARVFKQVTGCTPRGYRRGGKSE